MRMKSEEQLLDPEFRQAVIKEILGPENAQRKALSKKKYDIFKDGTRKYVIESFSKELDEDTVLEMKSRVANISILRKIVDKKAMVYKIGAQREVGEKYQDSFDKLVDLLNIDNLMKKVNKYLELDNNCFVYVAPYTDPLTQKKKLFVRPMLPYLYDVIEDEENPEIARAVIFSYYDEFLTENHKNYAFPNESGKRDRTTEQGQWRYGDGKNQTIADSPNDKQDPFFIWWSHKYHMTTDIDGELVEGKQEENLENPIKTIPGVFFHKDQDGSFWAIGGDDLIEGSVLVNKLLSDLYFIAKMQGQGIFYLIGPEVPETLKVGPNDAILMKKKEGDPDAQIGFATSSPPLDSHMKLVEQYVALLLSTNNLEPGNISGELTSSNAQSGIQEMIRMAENVDDIEDQREIYRDKEPHLFRVIKSWNNVLLDTDALHDDFREVGKIEDDYEFTLKFSEAKMFMTDKEKLEIIEKRISLDLDSKIDALMRDNPDLTRDEAKEKLKLILEEKLMLAQEKSKLFTPLGGQDANEEREEEEEKPEEEIEEEEDGGQGNDQDQSE